MKKLMLLLSCVIANNVHSQDSLKASKAQNTKRHEIGVNILPPFLLLCGGYGNQPKFMNATYRYLLSEHNALRATAGVNIYNSPSPLSFQKEAVSMTNGLVIYENTTSNTPSNFMVGAGYERIMGKRQLKHVVGFDLTYNYVDETRITDYYGMKDTLINNITTKEFVRIDTGRTVTHRYCNKIGITPFYSIRYALNKNWLLTASTRLNFQYYQVKSEKNPTTSQFDFNTSGLISEVSLFYRF